MKWTREQITELTTLCMSGTSNKDLAAHFNVPITEIHAKRSQHGITMPKVAAAQGNPAITVNPEFEAAIVEAEKKLPAKDNKFAMQVISKGSFIDDGVGDGRLYLVEAATIRLNHIALNEWILSEVFNCRDCYENGETGDAQWEAHKAEYAERRRVWTERITKALEIDSDAGSVSITQAQSEVFTVVHIREIDSPLKEAAKA